MGRVGRQERRELCDSAVSRLALAPGATYHDACYRVGQLMGEILEADLELRFFAVRNNGFSGVTAQCADGSYIVFCARSRSWYHRLGILLHELSHVMLGHTPVSLSSSEGIRRFLPHLPRNMIELIAGRTELTVQEEQDAEELADEILARLDEVTRAEDRRPSPRSASLERVAEVFEPQPWQERT